MVDTTGDGRPHVMGPRGDEGVTDLEPSILVVAPWLQGGGGQKALQGILAAMPRERIRLVVLFTGNKNSEPLHEHVAEAVYLDAPRTPLGVLEARRRLAPYLTAATSVYSLMRASHVVLGIGSTRVLKSRRFAATFHQLPSEDDSARIGRVENVFVRRAVRHAGLVTAPSPRAVEEIADRRFAARERIRFEANASDATSEGSVAPRDGELGTVRLLFAGRLTEQKGLDRIADLLAASRLPIHLKIAGDGELRSSVEALAGAAPAPHRIDYIGHTDDLPAELDWADALFMPSRWELNPMTVWESWARGRPVIASSLDVFHDLSTQGPVLVFDDAHDFAEQVVAVSADSPLRTRTFEEALVAFDRHSNERRELAAYLAG